MTFGFGHLRLAPSAFWSMTPRELAAAVAALPRSSTLAPPTRTNFDTLLKRFPDA